MKFRNRVLVFLSLMLYFSCKANGQELNPWPSEQWEQLEQTIMPVKPFEAGNFPRSVRWVFLVRIREPRVDPVLLSVKKDYSGKVEVDTTRLAISSLPRQVIQIRKVNPKASVSEVANGIKLVRTYLTSKSCSGLLELGDEFEHLSIPAVLPDVLIMDSTIYTAVSQSLYGNGLQMIYYGPGQKESIQEEPILGWIEKLRKLVDRNCK